MCENDFGEMYSRHINYAADGIRVSSKNFYLSKMPRYFNPDIDYSDCFLKLEQEIIKNEQIKKS